MTGLREFFDSYYRLRPINATFTGVHDRDDKLPDWSPQGLDPGAFSWDNPLSAATPPEH